ncbi:MAG: hypothetical protein ACE5GB_09690, partial [Acidimicrobiales bacterium]
ERIIVVATEQVIGPSVTERIIVVATEQVIGPSVTERIIVVATEQVIGPSVTERIIVVATEQVIGPSVTDDIARRGSRRESAVVVGAVHEHERTDAGDDRQAGSDDEVSHRAVAEVHDSLLLVVGVP